MRRSGEVFDRGALLYCIGLRFSISHRVPQGVETALCIGNGGHAFVFHFPIRLGNLFIGEVILVVRECPLASSSLANSVRVTRHGLARGVGEDERMTRASNHGNAGDVWDYPRCDARNRSFLFVLVARVATRQTWKRIKRLR